ncbi:MAG: hypothetical protein L6408_09195 [Nanoarchaeota archaeon]|nr:hypothetical protein [Nanoarchaeota archaeon]
MGIFPKTILHPDDEIEFIITASDPEGGEIEYGMAEREEGIPKKWQKDNHFKVKIKEKHIGKHAAEFTFFIRSNRKFHGSIAGTDDSVSFNYTVLPKRQS